MKKIILSVFVLIALSRISSAQSKEVLHLVYIDNSRPTREDVLDDKMLDEITTSLDEIKKDKAKFILFLSNGNNFTVTESSSSIDKMIDKLYAANSLEPDQYYDMQKMRDMVYDKLKGFSGTVEINYFVTGAICSKIQDKLSPLFSFFPREIYAFNTSLVVQVNIFYPAAYKLVDKAKAKSALEFFNAGEFSAPVTFNIVSL